MPSTYDPLLRLELQATGENATTWGIKTNTNLDLLAESIAGAINLNVAGSGDYTLSTANGAEDEARQAILVLTGLLTGNRNIIVPSSPKNYTVINNTTGAFTVTLKQASGSGLTIVRPGPTITVCTSTTCVDAIGATPYTKNFLAATSVAPAVSALGLANTATIVATSIGTALITAVDTSAGRAAISAVGTGPVTTSGLTMTTSKLLGRSTASTGAIEEVSLSPSFSLTGGTLALSPTASPQFRSQLFTSSGSWTVPTGVTEIRATVIGAGGGGGGADNQNGGQGGRAGVACGVYTVTVGTSLTVTVGVGGTGNNSGGGSGGGTSSLGSLLSATGGGGGGYNNGIPGSNGTGSSGTLRNITMPLDIGYDKFIGGSVRAPATGSTAALTWTASSLLHPGAGGFGETLGCVVANNDAAGGVSGAVYIEWVGL